MSNDTDTMDFVKYSAQVEKWADVTLEKRRLDIMRAAAGLAAELDEFYDEVEAGNQQKMIDEASDCIFWFTQFANIDPMFSFLVENRTTQVQIDQKKYDRLTKDDVVLMNNISEKLSRKKDWEETARPMFEVLQKHLKQVLGLTQMTFFEIAIYNYNKLTIRKSTDASSVND